MRIGEALLKSGLITQDSLEMALKEQKKTSDRLGEILLEKGVLTTQQMGPFLAQYFQIPLIHLNEIYKDIKPEVIDLVPDELAHRFTAIPISLQEKTLTLAMFDPLNLLAIDTIRRRTGLRIQCVVASETDILEAIEYCYHHLPRMQKHIEKYIDSEDSTAGTAAVESGESYEANDQPVVKYVKDLIVQATHASASDIHIQPKQDKVELRLRIDGVLHDMNPPPKVMLSAITTRIKIMAGLDIAERRLPQDGRFKMKIGSHEVDVRISAFPTIYGESVVMRLLDTSSPLLGLDGLGFDPDNLRRFKEIIKSSYGLVLVTGPTGSGKTTTLYTALNEIKSNEKNIITLEDPVEYRLPFIQQSQVNTSIGFDFARGLRSILRQDPDVIMVGEIRDRETAEIAIHAALTGHLVFSTLHTNDAAGAAVRLTNMGVEPFLITSSLLCVVAQRLIRTICPHCADTYQPSKDIIQKLALNSQVKTFYRGGGCPKCLTSGYKGRKGIYEFLIPDEPVRQLILDRRSSAEVSAQARKTGMKTLREAGIEKLKEGVTTPEELLRVTQQTMDF